MYFCIVYTPCIVLQKWCAFANIIGAVRSFMVRGGIQEDYPGSNHIYLAITWKQAI